MTIHQASFFWRNDRPDGIGFTFGPPGFTAGELSLMFEGDVIKKFIRDSDAALGSNIVHDMLMQLAVMGQAKMRNHPIAQRQALLAALNITWLSSRGFIPNDEFNGVQFVTEMVVKPPNGSTG